MKSNNFLAEAIAAMHEINRRNNYGHILPVAEFADVVSDGQKQKQMLQDALEAYNAGKPSKERYLDKGLDHYAHRYINYKAAQHSPQMSMMATVAGLGKELSDFPKYWIKNGFDYAANESKKDLQENKIGRIIGQSSSLEPKDNQEFNKHNSKTVNFLLSEILRGNI